MERMIDAMRLPKFIIRSNAENYSPQVEKLLTEWEAVHAINPGE